MSILFAKQLLFGQKQETEDYSLYQDMVKLNEETPKDVLPKVTTPFLPPKTDKKMTLVLDLDETLIHYVEKGEEG